MKLLIEIPEEAKQAFDCAESNDIKGSFYDHGGVIGNAIKNGTPIPEDATNGDVITSIINPDDENCVLICAHDGTVLLEVTEDWWDAPYKGGK